MENLTITQEDAVIAQRRKTYTFEYKLKILEECSSTGNMSLVCRRNGLSYQMVQKWKKESGSFDEIDGIKKRMAGGGRKPIIGDLEDAIFDWFCDRRTRNLAVTRKQIQNFAINFVKNIPNANQSFKASNHWLDNFMTRYDMSLRSKSTLFRLQDEEVVNRVISYKRFIDNIDYSQYVLNDCFAIDETAVYYGDYNRTTVDFRGATSVAIQATGYESERVTCILGLRLSGEKIPPLVIIKGATKPIVAKHGVWIISSEKAWSTQAVLRKYTRECPLLLQEMGVEHYWYGMQLALIELPT